MFIGLLYNKNDQKFRWLDNEILTWVRWDSGEPNCMQNTNIASFCQSNKENCVRLTDGYKLRTVDCKKFNYYMLCSEGMFLKKLNVKSKICILNLNIANKKNQHETATFWHIMQWVGESAFRITPRLSI